MAGIKSFAIISSLQFIQAAFSANSTLGNLDIRNFARCHGPQRDAIRQAFSDAVTVATNAQRWYDSILDPTGVDNDAGMLEYFGPARENRKWRDAILSNAPWRLDDLQKSIS